MLPPLQLLLMGYAGLSMTGAFAMPEIATALESFGKMALESAKWQAANAAYDEEMKELGFPAWTRGFAMVPFDIISDMLRGMRGAMLDMFRQPDKLLEAIERLYPVMVEMALATTRGSDNPRVFIALHRGADGFMSLEQFETFYWSSLKRLVGDLIDEGLTPCVFFEGKFDQRLEYLRELPPGKVLGLFDSTDMFKAKEVLGDIMCIAGNMPLSLLKTGTPEQVKDYSKKLIDVVGRDGGFIMSSATVMDEANPELVNVWKEFTREYGVYG
jgi:uroporphyrinogen-III decarboxylase